MQWLASSLGARRLWPVGYLNLEEGLTLARTDAPVANRRLASHIAITDEGPAKRWWLDTLAAGWVILPDTSGRPDARDAVVSRGGLRLLRNNRAVPVVSLADRPPDPQQPHSMIGEVRALKLEENSCSAILVVPEDAWVWVSLAPVNGWRWRLDGRSVTLQQGPGIVQFLEVAVPW